jgi:hypothetical protein
VKYLKFAGNVISGLVYLAVVIGAFSVATTKFETLVLAGIVQVYAAALYNFSALGGAVDLNNYAAFVRFRILATAHGVTGNEDGTFAEQEEALAEELKGYRTKVVIQRISNAAVSIYALLMILLTIFK